MTVAKGCNDARVKEVEFASLVRLGNFDDAIVKARYLFMDKPEEACRQLLESLGVQEAQVSAFLAEYGEMLNPNHHGLSRKRMLTRFSLGGDVSGLAV